MFASSLQLPAHAASPKPWLIPWLAPLLALALLTLPVGAPSAHAQAQRIRAPELSGGVDFLGVDKPFQLKDLRGKIVLLDFWTLC